MPAIPEVLLRALRSSRRLDAWCAAATVTLLAAGCGGGSPGAAVTVDGAKHFQRIAGFGVSEGFGQAKALMSAPASVQKRVLRLLYSPTRGASLTILRNENQRRQGIHDRAEGAEQPGRDAFVSDAG
jgi:hypothetical protein